MIRHEQENLMHPIVCCGNTGVHKLYQVLVTIQIWLREQKKHKLEKKTRSSNPP